ncbi:hypothetical protein BU17DRAFT_65761 [Hysterangium stoloniferum]|nr:hypothetical protein BU17DRAFT_65761 [Hysterangium stoloniferum]
MSLKISSSSSSLRRNETSDRHLDYEVDEDDRDERPMVSTTLEEECLTYDSDDEEGASDSDEEPQVIGGDPAYSQTTGTFVSRDYYPLPHQQAYFDAYEAANPGAPPIGAGFNLTNLKDGNPNRKGGRPPHGHRFVIECAIYGAPKGGLTLEEIYIALMRRFSWYSNPDNFGWKNSVRHALSYYDDFQTVRGTRYDGTSGKWWIRTSEKLPDITPGARAGKHSKTTLPKAKLFANPDAVGGKKAKEKSWSSMIFTFAAANGTARKEGQGANVSGTASSTHRSLPSDPSPSCRRRDVDLAQRPCPSCTTEKRRHHPYADYHQPPRAADASHRDASKAAAATVPTAPSTTKNATTLHPNASTNATHPAAVRYPTDVPHPPVHQTHPSPSALQLGSGAHAPDFYSKAWVSRSWHDGVHPTLSPQIDDLSDRLLPLPWPHRPLPMGCASRSLPPEQEVPTHPVSLHLATFEHPVVPPTTYLPSLREYGLEALRKR